MNTIKIIDLEIKRVQNAILEAIQQDNKELENELFLKRKILLDLQAKMILKEDIKESQIGQHYLLEKGVEYLFKDGELKEFNKVKEIFLYIYSGWLVVLFFGISIGMLINTLIK